MSTETSEISKSDAIHLRLATLWKSLMKIDYAKAVIHIDRTTMMDLQASRLAHHDASLEFGQEGSKWKTIPFKYHVGAVPFAPFNDSPMEVVEMSPEPFCLYIEAIKNNGRRIYIDDKQTDKQFL